MIEQLMNQFVTYVWSYPVVGLCLLAALFFTFKLRFVQFRGLRHALSLIRGHYDNPNEHGQITHFQALTAALSGTIGLGNIAGVAVAIATGGPGAVLWMWILGFFGMATKYAECTLGTYYREEDEKTGEVRGGPMYYITKGLGEKWWPMATFYAATLAFSAFGSASLFQSNQAAAALYEYYAVPTWVTGIVLTILAGLVILGGIKRIGAFASRVVPTMCGIYIFGAIFICLINIHLIPTVIMVIFRDAFTGYAAAGGAIGMVIKMGVRRAIFSNEAGLGTAPIAHAAVKTDYPIREGIVASLGPLIDTVIVCSATAVVIILSGNYGTELYQVKNGWSVGFDNATSYRLSGDWQIQRQGIPQNKDKLRQFRQGSEALLIAQSDVSDEAHIAAIHPIPVAANSDNGVSISDGIRFSYYRQSGDMRVHLRDGDGQRIGSLSLNPGKQALYDKVPDGEDPTKLIDVIGHGIDQSWQSIVLRFSPSFKDLIQSGERNLDFIQIEFEPIGGPAHWYIDRVQPVRKLSGVALTTNSFDHFFHGFGSVFITFAVFFFAFSTLVTWSYYGETAAKFIFGKAIVVPYKILFVALATVGAIISLDVVLSFSDGMLGLLVIPNMIAIFALSGKVLDWTRDYFAKLEAGQMKRYK